MNRVLRAGAEQEDEEEEQVHTEGDVQQTAQTKIARDRNPAGARARKSLAGEACVKRGGPGLRDRAAPIHPLLTYPLVCIPLAAEYAARVVGYCSFCVLVWREWP
jgi:hypothetical protein